MVSESKERKLRERKKWRKGGQGKTKNRKEAKRARKRTLNRDGKEKTWNKSEIRK